MKELNKVLSHKSFRIALVALLAVIMVTAFVVEHTNLTRAGDEAAEPVQQESTLAEEVAEPAPAPAPDPEPAPAPAEPAEATEAPEATVAPTEGAEATVAPTEAAAAEATPEATLEPVAEAGEAAAFANAEEDLDFRTGYATTLGNIAVYNDRKESHELANLPEGAVVQVTKRVEKKRDGEVVETWMGVRFMAEENDEGELVTVEGYVPAWSLRQLDEASYLKRVALYERSLLEETAEEAPAEEAIEEDIGDPVETAEGVPVVRVRYYPVPAEEKAEAAETEEAAAPEATEVPVEKPAPRVEVSFEHEGELVSGTTVTLHAKLINMPEGKEVSMQWKNDATGEFEAVPGATGESFAFQVNAENIDWKWVMEVRIGSGA